MNYIYRFILSLIIFFTLSIPYAFSYDYYGLLPAPYNMEATFDPIDEYVHYTWECDYDSSGYSFQFFVVKWKGITVGTSTSNAFSIFTPYYGPSGTQCISVEAYYDEGVSYEIVDCCTWGSSQLSIEPGYHNEWVMNTNDSLTYYINIFNSGNTDLSFSFPGFSTGSPPPGYISNVSPASGVVSPDDLVSVAVSWNSTGYAAGSYNQELILNSSDISYPVATIRNDMYVQYMVYVSGTVTDSLSHQAISGANMVDHYYYQSPKTFSDGSYLMERVPDMGAMSCYKTGYFPNHKSIGWINPGDTAIFDYELTPIPYPVNCVNTSIGDCNMPGPAIIDWCPPYGDVELLYDDGSAEDLFAWADSGNENAVRISPDDYPARLYGGSVYLGDGSYPEAFWLSKLFRILVYDENPVGMPGNLLDSIEVPAYRFGWLDFYKLDVQIDSGDFFISMKQLNDFPLTAPIGIDNTPPLENRSYTKISGGSWAQSANGDFMIRAFVSRVDTNAVDYYSLARVSGFDPINGPATGIISHLIDTNSLFAVDNDFQSLAQGWYAYAVQTVYTSGETSPWEYSNVIGNNLGNIVTFNIEPCLDGPKDGFIVSAEGQDWPYEQMIDTTDIDGICVFECMWTGNYDYTISKCGYEDILDNITVSQDTTVEITSYIKLYKPRNLWVDSITAIAYWDEPLITALLDDFEEDIYANGWQMTTNGVGWLQTDDGGSTGFFIPPTGSTYMSLNDNDAGSGNDACCDYLITPLLDLCEADNYMLSFDSYFTGVNGQQATVEYTLDAGASWINLYTLSPAAGIWEHIEIDLSAFSGANAADDFFIAFHADDGGGQASGWAIDNVDINAGSAGISYYLMFLDSAYVATMDSTFFPYSINYLTYGVDYTACVASYSSCGYSEYTCTDFTSGYLPDPLWLKGDTLNNDVHLMWKVDTFFFSSVILGYNVYRDSVNIAYVPYQDEDTSYYTDIAPDPMCYDYHVSTLFDLSTYGFPGDTGESQYKGTDEVCLTYGTTLPYNQNWESGSFEPEWIAGDNWIINGQFGNPMPSAEFTWDPVLLNYSSVLLSGAFNGISPETKGDPYVDGSFILTYDVKLDDVNQTGDEHFVCEVWADGLWHPVASYDNGDGSFDWITEEIDITEIAFGKIFKVRFVAEGLNSSDILSWFVDNISIERMCYPPSELTAEGYSAYEAILNWRPPHADAAGAVWLYWDDGINIDGIGLTGGGVFSIASRMDADMLSGCDGSYITKIRFFVYANAISSTYTLKVWEGTMAETLLYEESTSGLIIGDWNEIILATPVAIDITKDLWFGYTVDHPDGENPAGFAAGPAVVGYGDMIALDSIWEPITNYGFDLNWNLQALISDTSNIAPNDTLSYHIYFNRNGAGFEFLDETTDTTYIHYDEDFEQGGLFCYYVTAVYADCDANSNEACWWSPPIGIEENEVSDIVSIFPNPTSDHISIESAYVIDEVCVLDLHGRNIFCRDGLNETEMKLDVSAYEPGVYILRVNTEQGRAVRKIVVTE